MELRIVTSGSFELSLEVGKVFFPGIDGSFEVLDNHAPIIAALGAGVICWEPVLPSEEVTSLGIREGFVEVKDNRITVVCDTR